MGDTILAGRLIPEPDFAAPLTADELCKCGNLKAIVADVCQECHLKQVHRLRRVQHRAHRLALAVRGGSRLRIEPGPGLSGKGFVQALRELRRPKW